MPHQWSSYFLQVSGTMRKQDTFNSKLPTNYHATLLNDCLNISVLKQGYCGGSGPKPWLLMPGVLSLSGHCLPSQRMSTAYAMFLLTHDRKSKCIFIFSKSPTFPTLSNLMFVHNCLMLEAWWRITRQCAGTPLVRIMACHLFVTRP